MLKYAQNPIILGGDILWGKGKNLTNVIVENLVKVKEKRKIKEKRKRKEKGKEITESTVEG